MVFVTCQVVAEQRVKSVKKLTSGICSSLCQGSFSRELESTGVCTRSMTTRVRKTIIISLFVLRFLFMFALILVFQNEVASDPYFTEQMLHA